MEASCSEAQHLNACAPLPPAGSCCKRVTWQATWLGLTVPTQLTMMLPSLGWVVQQLLFNA